MESVAVIGGGVAGCATLRALAKRGIKGVLLEAQSDLCGGATRANSAISHAGYDPVPGTLMAKLNVEGTRMMPSLCEELGIVYRNIGAYVLAFDEKDMQHIRLLLERGRQNGVPGLEIISGQEVRQREKRISDQVIAALWAPSAGVVSPYGLAIAMADNAVQNGAKVLLNFKVSGLCRQGDGWLITAQDGRTVQAQYVVNAAGAGVAPIAAMVGDTIRQTYRTGEYLLLDHTVGDWVEHIIFQPPTSMGKGILVTPTPDGNLLLGPTSHDVDHAEDRPTHAEGMQEIIQTAQKSVPELPLSQVITEFAGVRTLVKREDGVDDFSIFASENAPGVVHAAGICSPGISAAPAMGEYIADMLEDMGLEGDGGAAFNPVRPHEKAFCDMNWAEREQAVAKDDAYAHIVCRCETVTEAEIVAAIHAPVPAVTLDAIKRRTRAGMGRCQGGFCTPRVMEILSRELGVPMEQLTKCGGNSWLCMAREGEVPHGNN
nr:NAD(P)/FAD-dependent oxidoreductase [bacterium]